jgi:uncharacterized protein
MVQHLGMLDFFSDEGKGEKRMVQRAQHANQSKNRNCTRDTDEAYEKALGQSARQK